MVSAKEISDVLGLSFDFMAKTLQSLLRSGVLSSQQGTRGGYKLARKPEEISLADIINSLEEKSALVECMSDDHSDCSILENCTLRNPINILQIKIDDLFRTTYLSELVSNVNNKKINISFEKVLND